MGNISDTYISTLYHVEQSDSENFAITIVEIVIFTIEYYHDSGFVEYITSKYLN